MDAPADRWINAWADVTRAYEEVRGALERASRDEAGIPLPWFEVLLRLDGAPTHRARMSDLACSVGFSDSGISRLVDRMEDADLVTRELSRTDRRATEAVLTPKGRETLARATGVLAPAVRRELTALTDDEIDTLAGLMRRLGAGTPAAV
jgi:DNA-binding MarR family transcriptional regulator